MAQRSCEPHQQAVVGARSPARCALRGEQGRRRRHDTGDGVGARAVRGPRQCHRAWDHGHGAAALPVQRGRDGRAVAARAARGAMAKPADIADIIVFLASDRSRFITGEVVHANGGLYMA